MTARGTLRKSSLLLRQATCFSGEKVPAALLSHSFSLTSSISTFSSPSLLALHHCDSFSWEGREHYLSMPLTESTAGAIQGEERQCAQETSKSISVNPGSREAMQNAEKGQEIPTQLAVRFYPPCLADPRLHHIMEMFASQHHSATASAKPEIQDGSFLFPLSFFFSPQVSGSINGSAAAPKKNDFPTYWRGLKKLKSILQ